MRLYGLTHRGKAETGAFERILTMHSSERFQRYGANERSPELENECIRDILAKKGSTRLRVEPVHF